MSAAPDDPTFLQRLAMLSGGVNKGLQQFGGAGNLGMALLANSGYSSTPRSFGQTLGISALQAQQGALQQQKAKQDEEDAALMKRYREAQIQQMQAKQQQSSPFGNIDPAQYSPDSIAAFQKTMGTGAPDYSLLKKNEKPEAPLDELAKLNADFHAGRLSPADYKARRDLMTSRPANMYASVDANDPKVEAAAKLISRYDQAPLSGMAMRTPFGQAVTARVLELNPEYHGEEFPKRSAAYKAFATGKQGDQVKSFNVGISHLNTASDLAEALGNGDIRMINSISQRFAEATGNPAPTNLGTAKEVIKAEIVKAISGSGGGVADRERALEGIDKASSPAQLQGAIEVAKKLMGGQLGGLRRQYKNSTGREDFETLLSPDAIPYLATKEGMGDESTGTKPKRIKVDAQGNVIGN